MYTPHWNTRMCSHFRLRIWSRSLEGNNPSEMSGSSTVNLRSGVNWMSVFLKQVIYWVTPLRKLMKCSLIWAFCYSLTQDEPLLYLISLKNYFPYKNRMAACISSLIRIFTSLKLFTWLSCSLAWWFCPLSFWFILKLSLSFLISQRVWSDNLLLDE